MSIIYIHKYSKNICDFNVVGKSQFISSDFKDAALARVLSWPAAVTDRFLVVFQGKAGG